MKRKTNTPTPDKNAFDHPFLASSESYAVQYEFTVPFMSWLLAHYHPVNRKPDDGRIAAVEGDLKARRWNSKAGTLIAFNKRGNIIDGQHRLMGAIAAGMSLVSSVQFGLPNDAIKYKDVGRSRSAADNATLSAAGDRNQLPSDDEIIANRLRFRIARWLISGFKWMNGESNARAVQSHAALADAIKEHNVCLEFAMEGATHKHTKRPGYASALAIYFKKHPLKAIKFREQMTKGTGACEQVVALRDYLRSAAGGGNSPIYDHFNTVATINAFHHNRPIEGRLGPRLKTAWAV